MGPLEASEGNSRRSSKVLPCQVCRGLRDLFGFGWISDEHGLIGDLKSCRGWDCSSLQGINGVNRALWRVVRGLNSCSRLHSPPCRGNARVRVSRVPTAPPEVRTPRRIGLRTRSMATLPISRKKACRRLDPVWLQCCSADMLTVGMRRYGWYKRTRDMHEAVA